MKKYSHHIAAAFVAGIALGAGIVYGLESHLVKRSGADGEISEVIRKEPISKVATTAKPEGKERVPREGAQGGLDPVHAMRLLIEKSLDNRSVVWAQKSLDIDSDYGPFFRFASLSPQEYYYIRKLVIGREILADLTTEAAKQGVEVGEISAELSQREAAIAKFISGLEKDSPELVKYLTEYRKNIDSVRMLNGIVNRTNSVAGGIGVEDEQRILTALISAKQSVDSALPADKQAIEYNRMAIVALEGILDTKQMMVAREYFDDSINVKLTSLSQK